MDKLSDRRDLLFRGPVPAFLRPSLNFVTAISNEKTRMTELFIAERIPTIGLGGLTRYRDESQTHWRTDGQVKW